MRPPKSALRRRLQVEQVVRWARRPGRHAAASGVALIFFTLVSATLQSLNAAPAGKEALASHRKMLQALKELKGRVPDRDPVLGDFRARHLRAELEALESGRKKAGFFPEVTRWRLHFDLGREELQLGNEQRALEHSGAAFNLLPQVEKLLRADLPIRLRFQLGVSHLRVGETQNCCLRANPDSCILPIREGGIHTEPEGSRQAIRYFTQVLERSASDSIAYLESRWLLNIAHMTLGSYPEGVPRAFLIPPGTFESDASFPRFHNIAADLGLDTFNLAGGACADDFNNDGYLDLVVSTWDPAEQMRFFVNNGDGSFADRTREAGLTGLLGGINLLQADYDNDGHLDLLVLRGGWLGDSDRHPNSLLRNNGDGTFTDVTFLAGLGEVHYPTQTASWADFDNDGHLDLYVGNEATRRGIFLPQRLGEVEDDRLPFPCQLFRNNGDGSFTDVARQAGVANNRWTKGVIWADYDGDRYPDLYVSNFWEPNRLYRNNRDGTFTDVAGRLGVTGPMASFPAWFWDFDNDGTQDLYVSAYMTEVADLASASLGLPFETELPRLYRGDGSGGFEEVSRQLHLDRPSAPMGSNFGDLDNDGFLDFYLGTGTPDYHDLMPNLMYRNLEGKRFADVSIAGGFAHLQKGHGVVFADFDHDGDQDIFEQMGGSYAGDKYADALYENPGFGNRWIAVHLVGTRSNRSAVGARIRLEVEDEGKARSVFKTVNSGGTFGANPLRQTIGLGRASKVLRLEVFWPTSGETQVFRDVPMDRFIRIVEGENRYRRLSLPKFVLGGEDKGKQEARLPREQGAR